MNKKFSRIFITLLALVISLSLAAPAMAAEYTVVKGDSLSKIALRELGDANRWEEIYEANKDSIKDPNLIHVGQKLAIPGKEASANKNAAYLKEYFGIDTMTGTISTETYNAALVKIFGEDISIDTSLATGATLADAVVATVNSCGLRELALVYSIEKAATSTKGVKGVTEGNAAYIAAALDAGLASASWNYASSLDGTTAAQLLMNAAEIAGKGRNYLGNASDSDIARKLMSAWATFGNFDDPTLSQLGADLVISEASTGYNLKFDGYNANFLPKYTLQYGHSDITHAVQLIALLNSEGMDAKVALEPKTSIYEYMVEWGDPTHVSSTPTYELRPIEGTQRWLCYATEYDMKLEFDTVEDKNAFDTLIQQYAKKWLDKIDPNTGKSTENLLAGAWFQPLYTSTVPMADTENFSLIHDNVIQNGSYSIHPFSTVDGGGAIAAVVAEKAPNLSVDVVDLYVNNAFFRYLTGTGED